MADLDATQGLAALAERRPSGPGLRAPADLATGDAFILAENDSDDSKISA